VSFKQKDSDIKIDHKAILDNKATGHVSEFNNLGTIMKTR